jgi:hypothetical protein
MVSEPLGVDCSTLLLETAHNWWLVMNRRHLVASSPALAALLTACANRNAAAPIGSTEGNDRRSPGGDTGILVQPVLPGTDVAVGRNRFAIGILRVGQNGALPTPITDAQLNLRFFHPIEPQPVVKGEAKPQFRYVGDKNRGLYVADVEFDKSGAWGVEVSGSSAGQALSTARVQFPVKAKSETPAIGEPAPRSRNLTRHDVDDIKKIDSGAKPNDMHEVSIADAIEQKKPLVVAFASPGFCVTQTCAPQIGEVQQLKAKYDSQVNFVHIEIFKDPMSRTPFEAVLEWRLTSEPWTFLVDRNGMVADKFEGPAPFAELEAALRKLL